MSRNPHTSSQGGTVTPVRNNPAQWLCRIGSICVVLSVIVLGFVGALAVSSPASAAGSDNIQVKMTGDTEFSYVAAQPLLKMRDLVPGGSVHGSMEVRDNSGTTLDSGLTDTLELQMINLATSDHCPTTGTASGASCPGAGDALAAALEFTLDVTAGAAGSGGASLKHSQTTVHALTNGVMLAPGLTDGHVVTVALSASLPFASVGNEVQYGGLAFDLQLGIVTVAGESGDADGGNNGGTNGGDRGASGGSADGSGDLVEKEIEVEAAHETTSGADAGEPNVLVLGEHGGNLSHTGLPTRALLVGGGFILLAGFVLLLLARRRGTDTKG